MKLAKRSTVTDAEGRFVLHAQPAGPGELGIVDRDGITELAVRSFDLVPGQRLDLGTLAP